MLNEILKSEYPNKFNVDVLYHYTSGAVVDIFAQSGSHLYCTKASELNDESEFRIGLDRGIEYIQQHFSVGEVKSVKATLEEGETKKLWIPWIMSFSSEGDDLNQWKGYVDQKKGGYAVGFNRQALEMVIERKTIQWQELTKLNGEPSPYVMYLFPCFYNGCDDIDKLLDILFGTILSDYMRLQVSYPASEGLKRVATIISLLYLFAGIYKHEAYKDERETRIVLQNNTEIPAGEICVIGDKQRISVPGIPELITIKNCIKSICSSLHGDRQVHELHLKELSQKLGRSVDMMKSEIPYRG